MRWAAVIAPAVLGLGLPSLGAASAQDTLTFVPGSTKKVCQLTGDVDRERSRPTLSMTGKRFGVLATDLGNSFEHKGKLFFLFGDTWGRPGDRDGIAWTQSRDPAQIVLHFPLAKDGKWLPLTVPGVANGAFDVPNGGVSVGNRMYVVFTTDWNAEKSLMGRSVLAVSEDDGRTFQALYDLSTTKFINVSFWSSGGWLYIFGSGAYRKSSPYLARIRPAELSQRSRLSYFSGLGPDGQPQWSADEQAATALFHQDVIGEFSAAFCKPAGLYIMLYNSSHPRGITMRSAAAPWGPWSKGEVIFEPWRDGGYGHFMHIPANFQADTRDTVSDPGKENEWGGEYGPYLMARFTTGGQGQCRLFYTLSTWNPYQVVVMQTDLKLEPRDKH